MGEGAFSKYWGLRPFLYSIQINPLYVQQMKDLIKWKGSRSDFGVESENGC